MLDPKKTLNKLASLEVENKRLHDIEARMKAADNDATKFAIEASNLRQCIKALNEENDNLLQRVKELEAKTMAQEIDIQNLRKEYKQRGERMKYWWRKGFLSHDDFAYQNPEAASWFDPETGEPL